MRDTLQQLRGSSLPPRHWSEHGEGGEDGSGHDEGQLRFSVDVLGSRKQSWMSEMLFLCVLQSGCCEVITEEASSALRKANKWAQSGLIVSVGPPIESTGQENAGISTTGDKKKTAQSTVCRERNAELAR